MIIILLSIIIFLLIVNIVLTLIKKNQNPFAELKEKIIQSDAALSKIDPLIRDEFGRNREESGRSFKENREELNQSFKLLGDTLTKTVAELSNAQKGQFELFANRQEQIRKDSEANLKEIRETVEKRLQTLQEENSKKLEEMRKVVDEKLQETVEKRFNESFKLINERLEQVHKGLGEMQSLASGVGDLKKVLTNVKTRGNLGEIQLGAILEQILSPEQYEQNAVVRENSSERVEYVVKLPGKDDNDKSLLLPIDSKFPNEDYQRLLDAYENATDLNPRDREAVAKQFENSVKKSAKDIRDKYINPPVTTDFAILFVPTEGLYAEILRRTGLFESLQREYKITVVGPTNLVAFLSSLQMGFRTLQIEKRSSEVWEILGAVKTQFNTFGDILEKTKKKLQQATNDIDRAGVRSRAIERKLRTVHILPQEQTIELLGEAIAIEEDSRIETEEEENGELSPP